MHLELFHFFTIQQTSDTMFLSSWSLLSFHNPGTTGGDKLGTLSFYLRKKVGNQASSHRFAWAASFRKKATWNDPTSLTGWPRACHNLKTAQACWNHSTTSGSLPPHTRGPLQVSAMLQPGRLWARSLAMCKGGKYRGFQGSYIMPHGKY